MILSCAAEARFTPLLLEDSPSFFCCFKENNLIMSVFENRKNWGENYTRYSTTQYKLKILITSRCACSLRAPPSTDRNDSLDCFKLRFLSLCHCVAVLWDCHIYSGTFLIWAKILNYWNLAYWDNFYNSSKYCSKVGIMLKRNFNNSLIILLLHWQYIW